MAISQQIETPAPAGRRRSLPGGVWPWLLGGSAVGWGLLVFILLIAVLGATVTPPPQCGQGAEVNATTVGDTEIPARLVSIYQGAAARFQLGPDGWLYLASINKIETDFWTNKATSSAGAEGPMQFEPSTWATVGVDGDGDGTKDIYSEPDAIYGAANYLHASGAPGDWQSGIFAYNHAGWYVDEVEANVERWRGSAGAAAGDGPAGTGSATMLRTAAIVPAATADASPAAASTSTTGGLDVAAATAAAAARDGRVSFAVASSNGTLLASHDADREVNGRSITKAMILVAFLTRHPGAIDAHDQALLSAMIEQSSNPAADALYADVGRGAVDNVADKASMTDWHLRATGDPDYRLGLTQVTAADQARLFAMIDQLIPAAHRDYGLGLLESTDAQWGLLSIGLGVVPAKAGWFPETGGAGWTVNQGAQVPAEGGMVGVAVTTTGSSSFAYGQQSIAKVGAALSLATATAGTSGTGTPLCDAAAGLDPTGGYTLTPGERATVLPSGLATIPAGAPPQVQAMIAAGNRIVQRFVYDYGGGHGDPANSMNQTHPKPSPGNEENGGAGYDCSSSVSYTLWGGGPAMVALLHNSPQASGPLMSFGDPGPGHWVTLHSNEGHVFMEVAGIWMNTGVMTNGTAPGPRLGTGPHWGNTPPPAGYDSAFVKRHPPGL